MFFLHGIFTENTFEVNTIVIIFFIDEACKAENLGNFPKVTNAGSSTATSKPKERVKGFALNYCVMLHFY